MQYVNGLHPHEVLSSTQYGVILESFITVDKTIFHTLKVNQRHLILTIHSPLISRKLILILVLSSKFYISHS